MEEWDLYNSKREIIGSCFRGEQENMNGFHLVVHTWIRNNQGKYLISQRAADRPTFPLKWECCGGSVLKGEDSKRGALREVFEELGIDLTDCQGECLKTVVRKKVNGKIFNDILDIWLFEYNGEFDLEKATTKEVVQAKWMAKDEIKDLLDNGDLVETLAYFFEIVETAPWL